MKHLETEIITMETLTGKRYEILGKQCVVDDFEYIDFFAFDQMTLEQQKLYILEAEHRLYYDSF